MGPPFLLKAKMVKHSKFRMRSNLDFRFSDAIKSRFSIFRRDQIPIFDFQTRSNPDFQKQEILFLKIHNF